MRRGVLLLMYDLPVVSAEDRKETEKFRKNIRRLGYISVQKSIYAKLLKQYSGFTSELEAIDRVKPKAGVVQVLPMTLPELAKINTVTGDGFDLSLFSDDILDL